MNLNTFHDCVFKIFVYNIVEAKIFLSTFFIQDIRFLQIKTRIKKIGLLISLTHSNIS